MSAGMKQEEHSCHHEGCDKDALMYDYFCAEHTSIDLHTPNQPAEFVPHEEAVEIAQRFINRHFGNSDKEFPRISIPADARRDDDLRIMAYIKQGVALTARVKELETGLADLTDKCLCTDFNEHWDEYTRARALLAHRGG